jgi:SAM-dependent methyltransferase
MIVRSTCIVCNSKEVEPFLFCKDHFVSKEEYEIYSCKTCGFKYTECIPEPEKMGAYYQSEEYISHSDTQKGVVNKLYHTVRDIMLNRKAKLISKLTPGKKLLDIGCGTGYFPFYMKKQGYESFGMELDEKAREFAAENFGLDVQSPDTLLNEKHTGHYDIITLWHVLEHLHDPEKYLNWIKNSLQKDGVLLIALPNCSSYDAKKYKEFWAAYDVPRHLWHFEPSTFEKYITQFGFRLDSVKRLPFDAYYNSMMSAKYANKPLSFIHGVMIGYISNLKSFFNRNTTSSVIYVLRKN